MHESAGRDGFFSFAVEAGIKGYSLAFGAIAPGYLGMMPFRTLLKMARAQHQEQTDKETYRLYTADVLFYLGESVAQSLNGRCMAHRFREFIGINTEPEESGPEIIKRLGSKLEEMGGGNDGEFA